jgi:tetratricopeptide (TPR) repeat protein
MATPQPLDHIVLAGVRIEAFKHPLLDFLGGPVLTDPALDHFRHRRHHRACDVFDAEASFDQRLEGEWVYVGPKYHHFGHIMAEIAHRILPSRMFFPDVHHYMLVTTVDDCDPPGFGSLDRAFAELLEFCEIDRDWITIVNENTVVESLSICEQGSNFGGRPGTWYLDLLREFSMRRLDELHGSRPSPEKVYVSKSRIPHGGTILGESYIEELLSQQGFFIFHPEEAPLSVQMDVYRKAKELIFSEGSACHGTELLGTEMLGRTFVLVRRMEVCGDLVNVLGPRSKEFGMFIDTFLLGTIVVHPETRHPHTEFGVSLLDIDRFVSYLRDHELASLNDMDIRRYFDAAENDLKAYFSYHEHIDIGAVDAWRAGDVRVEFEKLRQRFLAPAKAADQTGQVAIAEDAESISRQAWAAHSSRSWQDAVRWWEIYRERFPYAAEGFTLGSVALIELGRFYEADALLRPAMERFPDLAEALGNYALVAQHRRDWREAASRWEAFRARFPHDRIGYSLGATALCELGRYDEADDVLLLGLERHPNDEELLESFAWAAEFAANTSVARLRWTRLATEYPNNPTALNRLERVQEEAQNSLA